MSHPFTKQCKAQAQPKKVASSKDKKKEYDGLYSVLTLDPVDIICTGLSLISSLNNSVSFIL